jgi:hypothetical protein
VMRNVLLPIAGFKEAADIHEADAFRGRRADGAGGHVISSSAPG